mmetsp:Transcript_5236/g.9253  ORF Transcript_5236/g.9253 Transcript_5236/m.9253 type:complete len:465 (-) Transcript_5236:13-1407(-)
MNGKIGSTTNDISVPDEVKQFKGRVLLVNRLEQEAQEREEKKESLLQISRKLARRTADSLVLLCLKEIGRNFEMRPFITKVPDTQIPLLTSFIDPKLDIEIASANIYDENYWRRRAMSQSSWKHYEIANHGMTWKQLYLEKSLQDLLETYVPDKRIQKARQPTRYYDDEPEEEKISEKTILSHLVASQDYVFQLSVAQLLSHIDLGILFENLPNLTRLELTYGVKRVGMCYDRSLFGMKTCDATSLACALKTTQTLTTLILPCNLIDDDLLRLLMTGLISNHTITHLDLSHNKITNHGVRLLCKLLGSKSVLTTLDLCDNQIHVEGGRYLGRALKRNNSLLDLNLRLNRLSDEGGRLLLEGLVQNCALLILNLSCNSLGQASARALCETLEQGRSNLNSINISCNELVEEDGEALVSVLGRTRQVVSLDVRKNQLTDSAEALARIVKETELETHQLDQTIKYSF